MVGASLLLTRWGRSMRRFIGVFFRVVLSGFLALGAWSARAAEALVEVTVYADAGYPPYSYGNDGVAVGIYADIMNRAFARMPRYRVTIEPVPWKRGLALVASGKAFAIYPPYARRKERTYIRPYSMPVLEEKVVVFCRPELLHEPRPRWPEDYFGLRIGSNGGFLLGGDRFRAAVAAGKIQYDEVGSSQQNILKLVSGRIDCYMNDRFAVIWEFNRLRRQGRLGDARFDDLREGAVISTEQGYLGFTAVDNGRYPFKDEFVAEFNRVITRMRSSGEIGEIVEDFLKH